MRLSKPVAYILLFLMLAIIVHSTVSLFLGNFLQATAMAPLLVVVYVFAIARKNPSEPEEEEEEAVEEAEDNKDGK